MSIFFGVIAGLMALLFIIISAIAANEAWNDEIQKHYDSDKEGFDD